MTKSNRDIAREIVFNRYGVKHTRDHPLTGHLLDPLIDDIAAALDEKYKRIRELEIELEDLLENVRHYEDNL